MSFKKQLNKLQTFTVWHDMDDDLGSACNHASKKSKTFDATFSGKSYTEFTRKQDDSVQEVLFRLRDLYVEAGAGLKPAHESLLKVRSELVKLKPLHDDIKSKRKNAQSISDRLKKSIKTAETLEKKVQSLRASKPGSPDFQRAENDLEISVRQRDADKVADEERQALLVTEEKEYKKQLFLCILNALEMYVEGKRSSMGAIMPAGQLAATAITIPEYRDSSIEALRTRIQEIRSEPDD